MEECNDRKDGPASEERAGVRGASSAVAPVVLEASMISGMLGAKRTEGSPGNTTSKPKQTAWGIEDSTVAEGSLGETKESGEEEGRGSIPSGNSSNWYSSAKISPKQFDRTPSSSLFSNPGIEMTWHWVR